MGMYTEINFACDLKEDTPKKVIEILKYMSTRNDNVQEPENLPDHPLFKTERWEWMLNYNIAYFDGPIYCVFREEYFGKHWEFAVRSNLKNYGSEIEKFFDWIHPYVDSYRGTFLGYYRYEESEDPTLIYYGPKGFGNSSLEVYDQ